MLESILGQSDFSWKIQKLRRTGVLQCGQPKRAFYGVQNHAACSKLEASSTRFFELFVRFSTWDDNTTRRLNFLRPQHDDSGFRAKHEVYRRNQECYYVRKVACSKGRSRAHTRTHLPPPPPVVDLFELRTLRLLFLKLVFASKGQRYGTAWSSSLGGTQQNLQLAGVSKIREAEPFLVQES